MSFDIPEKAQRELEANPNLLVERERQEDAERIRAADDPEVQAEARRAIRALSESRSSFSGDDVWLEMRIHPLDPAMLGPVMRWAQSERLVVRTDQTAASKLPRNQGRQTRLWRSLHATSDLGSTSDAVLPPEKRLASYDLAGFVCAHCHAPVNYKAEGAHTEDCPHTSKQEAN